MTASLERDLEKIMLQESRLVFKQFDAKVAWVLGCELRKLAESLEASVVIDISLHDRQLFHFATSGATADNADWVRRKRNTVLRCHNSSYGIGLKFLLEGGSFHEKTGSSLQDYATHGGGFPIMLEGLGCIGAITVSGLPQREDHMFVVRVLAEHLGQPLAELVLKEPA
jgi:uncharacterized protein (UPF0303 family)